MLTLSECPLGSTYQPDAAAETNQHSQQHILKGLTRSSKRSLKSRPWTEVLTEMSRLPMTSHSPHTITHNKKCRKRNGFGRNLKMSTEREDLIQRGRSFQSQLRRSSQSYNSAMILELQGAVGWLTSVISVLGRDKGCHKYCMLWRKTMQGFRISPVTSGEKLERRGEMCPLSQFQLKN